MFTHLLSPLQLGFLFFILARYLHNSLWISCCTASYLPGQRVKHLVVCDSAMLCTKAVLEGTGMFSWICIRIDLFPGQAQNLIVRDTLVIARWHHNEWYEHSTAFPSQVRSVSRTQCHWQKLGRLSVAGVMPDFRRFPAERLKPNWSDGHGHFHILAIVGLATAQSKAALGESSRSPLRSHSGVPATR